MPRPYDLTDFQKFLVANATAQSHLSHELACLERDQSEEATRVRIAAIRAKLAALRVEAKMRLKEEKAHAQEA